MLMPLPISITLAIIMPVFVDLVPAYYISKLKKEPFVKFTEPFDE